MPENLSKYSKLLVVSDTGMFQNENHTFAFGPVARELNVLLELFTEITWIGFKREDQRGSASYVRVTAPEIKTILLDHVGGVRITDKLGIVNQYPKMYKVIHSEIKKHEHIHSRAPSNPAIISAFLSKRYLEKQFWFKYAGSWKGQASTSYKFQRTLLKGLKHNSKVTVNGNWPNEKKHIIGFENPCLDEQDRITGKAIVSHKRISEKVNYCFVGNLDDNKGVVHILKAFKYLKNNAIGTIHIVGKGPLESQLKTIAKSIEHQVVFHGLLNKSKLIEIYNVSHFIILPSKSEGFPKVIGEAMNFGCVPIISNISCISDYITHNDNGFLLEQQDAETVKKGIQSSLDSKFNFENAIFRNHNIAKVFTYDHYVNRIKAVIFS